MALLLSVFRTQVDALITADADIFSQVNRDRQVQAAVERYSKDAPDTQTDDVTGDGGKYYVVTTELSSWVEGFSRITDIEYPAATIASDETPQYLNPEDFQDDYWADVSGTQTRHLYLPNHSPASTETMRITYTVPWPWAASSTTTAVVQEAHGFSVDDYVYLDSTWQEAADIRNATHQVTAAADADNFTAAVLEVDIPTSDFFAVCHLAAGLICQDVAARYARTSDSTILADSVGHTTRSEQHARRAKEFFALYEKHLGLGEEADTKAAGDFVDWDTAPGWPSGRDYIFHGRGVR